MLEDNKSFSFVKLLEFDNFFNICWFWVDLCKNICRPQNLLIFTKNWKHYCEMGINNQPYNFTQNQTWKKNSEIENVYCIWSNKKIFFGRQKFLQQRWFFDPSYFDQNLKKLPTIEIPYKPFFTIIFAQNFFCSSLRCLLSYKKFLVNIIKHKIS